ncbi:MAG: glutathione S-transferase N-terminal domain-containing protein [Coxiellaceae bacterium]|nr:glutathione S-transferase N-terminal domain-containing protein [Coxiellaceae bacterium]
MIKLYTAETPNGHKISIMLEELGVDYEFQHIKLPEQEQKQDWFLALNPNGRIPVIVDKDFDDYVVFESGAILLYLADKYRQLIPSDLKGRFDVIQWVFFQMANLGPYQGQANVFYRYAEEKIPYAINRFQGMTRNCYEILNHQLQDKEYLLGDYSIADIANFPWVLIHDWSGVSIDGLSHLQRWLETMLARPGVRRGLDIPIPLEELTKRYGEREQDAAKIGRSILHKSRKD